MKKLLTILAAALLLPCFCFGASVPLLGVTLGNATNVSVLQHTSTSNTFTTNVTIATNWNMINVSLGGAAQNGNYTLAGQVGTGTNAGGVAWWTNNSGNGWLLFQNDPGASNAYVGLHGATANITFLEPASNSVAGNWFDTAASATIAEAISGSFDFSIIALGAANITNVTTNVNAYQVAIVTNAYIAQGMSGSLNTSNLLVSHAGNDFYGQRGASTAQASIPFKTLGGAINSAVAGDNIIIETGNFITGQAINFTNPSGVNIYGNGSLWSGNYFVSDGSTVSGLSVQHTVLVTVTNATNYILIKDSQFGTASTETDAGELLGNVGTIKFVNCDFGNLITNSSLYNAFTWQPLNGTTAGTQTGTNSVTEFWNCRFMAYQSVANQSGVGAHGLAICVGTNGGGVIRLYGGSIEVWAMTNFVQGNVWWPNSCLSITGGPTTNQTTNFNTTLEINGTRLIHGSYNGALTVVGYTNLLGIPAVGYYYDCAVTNGINGPATNCTLVYLGTNQPTLFNGPVTASFAVNTTNNAGAGLVLNSGVNTLTAYSNTVQVAGLTSNGLFGVQSKLVVSNNLGSIGLKVTNAAPGTAELGAANLGMVFWLSNTVPYMSIYTNNAVSTWRVVGTVN